MKYTTTEKKFFVYHFFSSLWFHLPIWVLFFLAKGFTLLQVAFINSFFWASIVVFEIPTGYIADYFGRKISLILSYFTQSLGIGLFVIGQDAFTLILSSIIWGIGITMSSGAETAWLYDEIQFSEILINGRSEGQANDRYHNVFSSMQSLSHITMAFSQIIGGLLASIELYLPHTLVAIIFFFLAFYLFFIPEHKVLTLDQNATNKSEEQSGLSIIRAKPSLKRSFRELLNPITFSLATLILVLGTFMDIRYFMQDDLSNLGLSYVDIGIFFALIMVAMSIGNSLSVILTQNHLKKKSYVFFFLIISLGFIIMSITPLLALLFIFLLINVSDGILAPLLSKNINILITSENRATILSIISLSIKFVFIGFQIVISYVILLNGFSFAYLVTGLIVILLSIPASVLLLVKKYSFEPRSTTTN